LLLFRMELY